MMIIKYGQLSSFEIQISDRTLNVSELFRSEKVCIRLVLSQSSATYLKSHIYQVSPFFSPGQWENSTGM